jgi:hypothetical protein
MTAYLTLAGGTSGFFTARPRIRIQLRERPRKVIRSWTGEKVGATVARNLHKNEGRERVTLWGPDQ